MFAGSLFTVDILNVESDNLIGLMTELPSTFERQKNNGQGN
jgi:hypothetical protein